MNTRLIAVYFFLDMYWIAFDALAQVACWLQEEYAAEGIDWSYVEFIDNQDCLDLLEGSPVNPALAVFPLIDEACRMPRATYQVHRLLLCLHHNKLHTPAVLSSATMAGSPACCKRDAVFNIPGHLWHVG